MCFCSVSFLCSFYFKMQNYEWGVVIPSVILAGFNDDCFNSSVSNKLRCKANILSSHCGGICIISIDVTNTEFIILLHLYLNKYYKNLLQTNGVGTVHTRNYANSLNVFLLRFIWRNMYVSYFYFHCFLIYN